MGKSLLKAEGQVSRNVSVVSPVYGCATCLEDLVDRVETVLSASGWSFEMVLVDDASPDRAWDRILQLAQSRTWLRGVRLARNFGQHYAISAGIEHARGDVVVIMDCDLQDLPEEMPKLLEALQGDVEIVFALREIRKDPPLKRLGSWAFFRLLSWLTGVRQDHRTANFGAFTRKVIDAVNAMPERERCFPLMVKWTGFKAANVAVEHADRTRGRSGYDFRRLARLASGIVLSYSDKPLRIVVTLGLLFSAIAFLMAMLSIIRYLQGDTQVAGFTSIVASIWMVGGVSIFCLGILGLYLGRVFVDSKRRPYYLVASTINLTEPRT